MPKKGGTGWYLFPLGLMSWGLAENRDFFSLGDVTFSLVATCTGIKTFQSLKMLWTENSRFSCTICMRHLYFCLMNYLGYLFDEKFIFKGKIFSVTLQKELLLHSCLCLYPLSLFTLFLSQVISIALWPSQANNVGRGLTDGVFIWRLYQLSLFHCPRWEQLLIQIGFKLSFGASSYLIVLV